MALRPTMLPIIEAVRDLIGDPVTGNELLQAEQIQNKLDESREEVRYELLSPAPLISNDVKTNPAQMVWIDYYSLQHKYWEQDFVVQDAYWVQLTPVSFEPIAGHWQFSYLPTPGLLVPKAESPSQLPPVWVTGKVYDIQKAGYKCAWLLIGQLRGLYNFTADGRSLNRRDMIQNLKDIAAECARNIKPRLVPLVRSDASLETGRELLRIGGQYGTSSW